jgi:hypothetical protein
MPPSTSRKARAVARAASPATPAGAALYALYNAEENESRTVGNAFSRRNAAMIAKQRQRRAGQPLEPEPEKEVVPGSFEARQVRVPKVGRRKPQRGYYGPARPSKKPADQIISELVKDREQIISSNQLEAQRVATKTVDREVEKRRLARVHEMHGTDDKALEQQIKVDARRREKAKPLAEQIEDEFIMVMCEIEERHAFLCGTLCPRRRRWRAIRACKRARRPTRAPPRLRKRSATRSGPP